MQLISVYIIEKLLKIGKLKDIDNENLDFNNSDSERKKPIKKKRTVRNDYKKRGIKKTKSLDKINRKNEGS
jgi:hypothetical protein